MRRLSQCVRQPELMNMVLGGKTPIFAVEELGGMDYDIVLYADAALQGAVARMQRALTVSRDTRRLDEDAFCV